MNKKLLFVIYILSCAGGWGMCKIPSICRANITHQLFSKLPSIMMHTVFNKRTLCLGSSICAGAFLKVSIDATICKRDKLVAQLEQACQALKASEESQACQALKASKESQACQALKASKESQACQACQASEEYRVYLYKILDHSKDLTDSFKNGIAVSILAQPIARAWNLPRFMHMGTIGLSLLDPMDKLIKLGKEIHEIDCALKGIKKANSTKQKE